MSDQYQAAVNFLEESDRSQANGDLQLALLDVSQAQTHAALAIADTVRALAERVEAVVEVLRLQHASRLVCGHWDCTTEACKRTQCGGCEHPPHASWSCLVDVLGSDGMPYTCGCRWRSEQPPPDPRYPPARLS